MLQANGIEQVLDRRILAIARAAAAELRGAESVTRRTTRNAERAIKIEDASGNLRDISATRAKEFVPNPHPRAPPGARNPVKVKDLSLAQRVKSDFQTAVEARTLLCQIIRVFFAGM
jgi:hypothetical protein